MTLISIIIYQSSSNFMYIFIYRGILTTNSGWREQIEKQVSDHEIILSDLECRQVEIYR